MRAFPQGVTVVTTKQNGVLEGITVSSFTSVSMNPPLVLISIGKMANNHDAFTHSKEFVISVLAADQAAVSDRFAGKVEHARRFEGLGLLYATLGAPVIEGCLAYLECRTLRAHEEGDHTLVIGEVVNARKLSDAIPLVYRNQKYTTVEKPAAVP
jgi:flavin reductase (DIM6/NTAB) family NADH-FMN oxidoreductase RutF